ncbi:aminotransferase class V-fold PLP-dependent enzyme [Corynebacterium vitaeruminis]|uniref:aminotransferase class V-fold PLP-dependent enzyme n=1 Tax=Corynebacterium vitaeruminis TaxID=38305 RepID=UPI0023F21100|nr:aminotransferase class V-fold PLP-dependent enzyme [Corynebacterium vitaeruminis]
MELLDRAETHRRWIEEDTASRLGDWLRDRIATDAHVIPELLGLPGGQEALTVNATEGANAVAASAALRQGDVVTLLSTEYSSVIAAWREWTSLRGSSVQVIDVRLPATRDSVLGLLDRVASRARILVLSVIASTSALALPVEAIGAFCEERDIDLVLDAAHVVGHLDCRLDRARPAAVFGTLHKWLPCPRPVGFLWASENFPRLHPSLISLHREGDTAAERFGWRGTWDPAPLLTLREALEVAGEWERRGLTDEARRLADSLAEELMAAGLTPTGSPDLIAPRLRAFALPDVDPTALKAHLQSRGLRVWVGADPVSGCVIRYATHVYTTAADLSALSEALLAYPGVRQ